MQKLTTIDLLKETLKRIVADIKVSEEQSEEKLSDMAFYRFVEELGGIQFYITKASSMEIRNKLIKKEFKGDNILELSRKYRLSFVKIYKILKDTK